MVTEREYNDTVDMFNTDAWRTFIEVVEGQERSLTEGAVDGAVSNDQWQYCRGRIHTMRQILNYDNFFKLSYEQQNEEDDADSL